MRARLVIGLATTVALVVAGAGTAAARGQRELAGVRRATVAYHDVAAAEADGYERFLDCFDSAIGGMGQHFVDLAALDDVVEANHPEAMVYEVKKNRLKLVAVEYIVPDSPAVAADPPELFGRQFHLDTDLDVWVLHAWIWRGNPAGMFQDWNPNVGSCP